jgi:hypothetical protein
MRKRQRIKNLEEKKFEELLSFDKLIDFESLEKNNFPWIGKFFKSDTTICVGKGILILLAIVGVLTIAMVGPNLFIVFSNKNRRYYKKFVGSDNRDLLHNLKKSDYIDWKTTKEGFLEVRLTDKGKNRVKEVKYENMFIEKPLKWDRRWRIAMFDVPEKHKSAREALRIKLRDLGFYKLQDSVFVYPYECFKEIDAICRIFNVTGFVRYVTAEHINYDEKIKKYFNI